MPFNSKAEAIWQHVYNPPHDNSRTWLRAVQVARTWLGVDPTIFAPRGELDVILMLVKELAEKLDAEPGFIARALAGMPYDATIRRCRLQGRRFDIVVPEYSYAFITVNNDTIVVVESMLAVERFEFCNPIYTWLYAGSWAVADPEAAAIARRLLQLAEKLDEKALKRLVRIVEMI